MSDRCYAKALDDYCSIGGGDLLLEVVVGDPLIDKSFVSRVAQARSRPNIEKIKTITNLIALKDDMVIQLLKSGLTHMNISLGPLEKDTYTKIYRTTRYDRMYKNLSVLLLENSTLGCPIEITLAFRSNLSLHETLALPDYLSIRKYPHKVEYNSDYDTWTGEIARDDLLPGMEIRRKFKIKKEPCIWLYDGPIVFSNGNVGLCGCRDYNADSELVVGNIQNESLIELWRSKKVSSLRERFYEGNFPDICSKCTEYRVLQDFRMRDGGNRAEETRKMLASSSFANPSY